MVGVKGKSGGARNGAGHPKGTASPGSGRIEGTVEVLPRDYNITARKWEYAEKALAYADEMLEGLYKIAVDKDVPPGVRVVAMNSILDRALGKAPQHIDISAIRHTEVVYRSAEQIEDELRARGVPQVLLDYRRQKNNAATE